MKWYDFLKSIERSLRRAIRKKKPFTLPETAEADREIIRTCKPYTMTGFSRLELLIKAVDYCVGNQLQGDVVECGVWRGGSMMCAQRAMLRRGVSDRAFWLYDTFEGMPNPTAEDDPEAHRQFAKLKEGSYSNWCRASLEDVRANITSTGYPLDKVHFIQGKVEETLSVPANVPQHIALLRLDTDFYSSTIAELETLYPRVVPNGIVILDDYGHWSGARQAVDEFFAKQTFKPFLGFADQSCRYFIKSVP